MKIFVRITRIAAAACALATATTTLAQELAAAPAPATEPRPAAVAPATEPQAAATTAPKQATITAPQEQRPRYGFGISTGLVPGASGRLDTQGLGLSFAILRGRLRIEPELNFYLTRMDVGGGDTYAQYLLSIGGGALYELARAEASAVYAGGRLALSTGDRTLLGSSDWSTGETLSAVLGGEYFPAQFVSIGLEARAGVSVYQNDGTILDTVIATTGGLLVLRFYVP